jgi:iron-sulfur cluster assembly protein
MSITLTERAATFVHQAVADNDELETATIRVGVDAQNGYTHTLELTDEVSDADRTLKSRDVTILVDPKAWLYLQGTTIDFSADVGGFVFDPASVR